MIYLMSFYAFFFFGFHVHYKCQNERVGGDDDDDGEDITERGRVSAILF